MRYPAAFVMFGMTLLLLSGCSSGEQEFSGRYYEGMEASVFVPGDCSPSAPEYWVETSRDGEGNRELRQRYRQVLASRPAARGETCDVHVRFIGRLSKPGRYGHLNQYKHQVTVIRVLEMVAVDPCPEVKE